MFFSERIGRERLFQAGLLCNRHNLIVLVCLLILGIADLNATGPVEEPGNDGIFSDFIPIEWQENIFAPVLFSEISIVSIASAGSGIPGHTDFVLRYTIKNDDHDTLNCVQIDFDLVNQIGTPPFVMFTGSLTAMTGSNSVFGPVITGSTAFLGGMLNHSYNGTTNDSLFSKKPTLGPRECIRIDIPFEIGDTSMLDPIVLSGVATGSSSKAGILVSSIAGPFTLIEACRSESLACSGQVNISLGPECIAVVGVDAVFLNKVLDPNRYSVAIYDGNIAIGDTVNESHVGKTLIYEVLDGCFNNRVSCWGNLKVENKNAPKRTSTIQHIVCGETAQPLKTLDEIIMQVKDQCSVEVDNFIEYYNTTGGSCTGFYRTRYVIGDYEIDGWKFKDTVHADTIWEVPIDIDTIMNPIGGPDKEDAISIDCDSLDTDVPSPAFIAEYFDSFVATTGSGTAFGYPYIKRGTRTMEMYETRDTVILDTVPTKVEISPGVWANIFVLTKDTITLTDTIRIEKPNLVPIKKGTTCNLTTNYKDDYFPGCTGDQSKIIRTWTVLNWCTGQFRSMDQWIIIDDRRGPDIDMPDTVNVGIIPWTCLAEFPLEAEISDNCSGVKVTNWASSAGIIGEDNVLREITVSDSPIIITLQAVDGCDNDSIKTLVLNVVDSIPPVVVTKDQVNTSIIYDPIGERGLAKVTAESLNQDSHDHGCGPVDLCVLLEEELNSPIFKEDGTQATDGNGNPIFTAYQCEYDGIYEGIPYVICKDAVKFCCDQIGEHKVMVIGNDQSRYSFSSIGWSTVVVEDKSFPIVECRDTTVVCGTDLHPNSLGYPNIYGGLCNNIDITWSDSGDTDQCGRGDIFRAWMINGDTLCVQVITLTSEGSFDPMTIKWPKHYDDGFETGIIRECLLDTIREFTGRVNMGTSFVCEEDSLEEPVWCQSKCGLVVMSYEDLEVEADDACKKIVRKWTIIDWCNYDPNSNNPDVDDDSFEAVSDIELNIPNVPANLRYGQPCESCDKPSSLNGGLTFFRYTSVDRDGFYTYEQVLKVTDNTPPLVDAPAEVTVDVTTGATTKDDDFDDCVNSTIVYASAVELCGDVVFDASRVRWEIEVFDEEGTLINSKEATGDSVFMNSGLGAGNTEHTIIWRATDGCGNVGVGQTVVEFRDVILPTPLCITDLSTSTMGLAGATIWASDYDRGSFDNCSEIKTFFRNDDGTTTSSLTLTCDDIPNGVATIKEVQLFVADEAGNESYCFVSIRVDDTDDVCQDTAVGMASISGNVMTFKGDMIEDAEVLLNNGASAVTDITGAFAFVDLPMASTYKLKGYKNNDPLNGVSTLDLVLIQRHILALDTFDSPLKILAADVTNDQRVSAIDLVQMRRLILGITTDFPNNFSWRFVDPDEEDNSVFSPWPFSEEVIIPDLAGDMYNQNLLGVKIGDVSGNAIANSLLGRSRSLNTMRLFIDDQQVREGDILEIPVNTADVQSLAAIQLTLETKGLRIESLDPMGLNISDIHYAIHNDTHTTLAWSDANAMNNPQDLFVIRVTVLEDVRLSDAINISNRITSKEASTDSGEVLDIELEFVTENGMVDQSKTFELYQNEPNPFTESTSIGFIIPSKGETTLTIMDISGRILWSEQREYPAGYNEIIIEKDAIPASGIMYYRLENSGYTQTRKMILIR